MIDIIADSIDDLEDTTQVIDYLKREDGLNSLIYNLTEEDLEVPAIKQTAENILSDYNIPQNIDNMTALKSIIRKTLKSDPNNEKVSQFLDSTIKTIFNEIDSKIEGVSEVKRVISSELPPEEFLQWLGEEATSLGIYWSYGSGFAYDADTNHPYRYTFVTNINKEDVDILRTELASLRFNKNEEEIRLKQGVPITLTQVLDSDGNELSLTPEITGKTFYSSETKKEGSRMLHIERIASSEDLELSRGEIGVSIEDYDPSKDKEKSTKNRWSEKPNQNTAVIPATYQESDNYKKDKLDKAKYTNFLGRTDQDKPVELTDFALPHQPARKDETFEKHTDTIQDDQQQYDTRNFGKGKMKPTQHSNFLYKSELLHLTTIDKIAAEAKDSAGETSITPTVTDNVVDQITQKPTDNVTQGKGGGKSVKGTKRGGTGTRPVKALYSTNLKSIDIIADQFGDGVTRTELPESSLKRFRGQDANEKNDKENKDLKKKMKGKPNKPLHNVPKKDVYAWGNDDLNGGALFFSDLSLPQMGDLSEMN